MDRDIKVFLNILKKAGKGNPRWENSSRERSGFNPTEFQARIRRFEDRFYPAIRKRPFPMAELITLGQEYDKLVSQAYSVVKIYPNLRDFVYKDQVGKALKKVRDLFIDVENYFNGLMRSNPNDRKQILKISNGYFDLTEISDLSSYTIG